MDFPALIRLLILAEAIVVISLYAWAGFDAVRRHAAARTWVSRSLAIGRVARFIGVGLGVLGIALSQIHRWSSSLDYRDMIVIGALFFLAVAWQAIDQTFRVS